jgi:hypothetical protein
MPKRAFQSTSTTESIVSKSDHPTHEQVEISSDPVSSALDQAFSNVAADFRAAETASPRSTFFDGSSRPLVVGEGSALRAPGDPRPIIDSCNFYMTATSFAPDRLTDPLEALDPKFRKIVRWGRFGSNLNGATDAIVFMQRPDREFVPDSELRFVAIDPATYQGKAVLDRAAHEEFWTEQMNGRPFSMPFLKSGTTIWKKLGIKVDPETTAYMLQMRSVDRETSEAVNAAIWSAFNTARRPIDFETAAFVLASFMHADPLRQHLVVSEAFVEPYGSRTVYGLCELRAKHPADPAHPRYLPIEADDVRRQQIEADVPVNPDHLGTLKDLRLLLASDVEKTRVFCGTLDQEAKQILDDLLEVAICEIEQEHATVVGVVNALILRMLDIRVALRRDELEQLIGRR